MTSSSLPSNHPDYARARRLARLFNLTLEDYDRILAYQRGRCAICKKPPKKGGNRLAVDHLHRTGLVRGLVCWSCNRLLKMVNDDLAVAQALYEYLAQPPAVAALGAPRYGIVGPTEKRRRMTRKPRKK